MMKTTWDFEEEKKPSGEAGKLQAEYLKYSKPEQLNSLLVVRVTTHPWFIIIWEEIPIVAPPMSQIMTAKNNPFLDNTKPYCCYARSVYLYKYPYRVEGRKKHGYYEAWGVYETILTWDEILIFEGERFLQGSGTVVFADDKWWMRHSAKRIKDLNVKILKEQLGENL